MVSPLPVGKLLKINSGEQLEGSAWRVRDVEKSGHGYGHGDLDSYLVQVLIYYVVPAKYGHGHGHHDSY